MRDRRALHQLEWRQDTCQPLLVILVYHQPQHGAPLHLRPLQHFLHGCLCTQQLASGNLNHLHAIAARGLDGLCKACLAHSIIQVLGQPQFRHKAPSAVQAHRKE